MIYLLHKIVVSYGFLKFQNNQKVCQRKGGQLEKMMNIIELNDGFQWFSMVFQPSLITKWDDDDAVEMMITRRVERGCVFS